MKVLAFLLIACFAVAEDELPAAKRGVDLVRASAKDPDSLVIERIYAKTEHKPGHPWLCIRYRAKNSLGGYVREMAQYKGSSIDRDTLGGCASIESNWDRAVKRSWTDITEQYAKSVSASPRDSQ